MSRNVQTKHAEKTETWVCVLHTFSFGPEVFKVIRQREFGFNNIL